MQKPASIQVDHFPNCLRLTYHWFRAEYLLLAGFCVLWDGFLVLVYCNLLSSGQLFPFGVSYIALHTIVGIVITYRTAAQIKNYTTIEIKDGLLTIRHGPIPWFGDKTIPTHELSQLYCEKVISYRKTRAYITYRLNVISKDAQKIRLISGIETAEEALFLERQIEKHLGIKDQEVQGEIGKVLHTQDIRRRS